MHQDVVWFGLRCLFVFDYVPRYDGFQQIECVFLALIDEAGAILNT